MTFLVYYFNIEPVGLFDIDCYPYTYAITRLSQGLAWNHVKGAINVNCVAQEGGKVVLDSTRLKVLWRYSALTPWVLTTHYVYGVAHGKYNFIYTGFYLYTGWFNLSVAIADF